MQLKILFLLQIGILKDEAAEDEDIDFEENGDCEEYGRDYRFDEDEVEDAINFLFYYEECLPDDTDKAINDYRKYDDQLADAQSKLRHIEKKINMLVKYSIHSKEHGNGYE